jgi:hypothetical protein
MKNDLHLAARNGTLKDIPPKFLTPTALFAENEKGDTPLDYAR